MRVVVTGGGGFLGRATCDALRAAGHEAIPLDNTASSDAQIVCVDVTNEAELRAALTSAQPDAVVHLAAVLTGAAATDVAAAVRVNAVGSAAVFAEAMAAGVRRIVYASSVAALGVADLEAGDEAAPAPRSVYGATKAFAEHLATALACNENAPVFVGLRLGWVYGPGRDRGWREPQAVIEAALRRDPVVRYPDYPEPIDWTWVGDAAAILAQAAVRPVDRSVVLNVAGDKRRMSEAVAILARRNPSTWFEPYATRTPPSAWAFRNHGLEGVLGCLPSTTLEEGIDRFAAIYTSKSASLP